MESREFTTLNTGIKLHQQCSLNPVSVQSNGCSHIQQQGFEFCYDKKLYDRMEHSNAEDIRLHLCADLAYQAKLLRFIENHDEPRAAEAFSHEKQRAFAVTIGTLPGIKLFHEGQFEGRKVRVPVFLARRPDEAENRELKDFYSNLFDTVHTPVFREGDWTLCSATGWPDNTTFKNLVSWTWVHDNERFLIIVNLSDVPAQGLVKVPWNDAGNRDWKLNDLSSGTIYERHGDEMLSPGLYVQLGGWGYHFLQCMRTNKI